MFWMIVNGFVQLNSVYGWEDVTSSEDRTRSARSVGQRLTHWATGGPNSLVKKNIKLQSKADNLQRIVHTIQRKTKKV